MFCLQEGDKDSRFQFYISSIKSSEYPEIIKYFDEFQFYISSIKRPANRTALAGKRKFQFYISSIKRLNPIENRPKHPYFNSTLVRLKVN